MMKFFKLLPKLLVCGLVSVVMADPEITVPMYFTAEKGLGKLAGSVVISQTKYGLIFTPNLKGLTYGIHGFHIHEVDSCLNNGMAAGGHFDPLKTGKHRGPYRDDGHLGDLPVLVVNAQGVANTPVLAPRLKSTEMLRQHALMLHEGGDNYSDEPKKLGGGGGRMICGVVTARVSNGR